jgi:hypothetical protein
MEIPKYSYTDEIATPADLNIQRDGSFDAISRAVAGINYYSDVVGFGESTQLAKQQGMVQKPLGIRFFLKTGQVCSNGANMYEYVDTIPKGGNIGPRTEKELKKMGLSNMRGLAPGILEDSIAALDPNGLLNAVTGTGYPKCKKVTQPVGDVMGRVKSQYDDKNVWIKDPYKVRNGLPTQSRWVFEGWITKEEYDATPKTELPDQQVVEGFTVQTLFPSPHSGVTLSTKTSQVAAAVLLGLLAVGVFQTMRR